MLARLLLPVAVVLALAITLNRVALALFDVICRLGLLVPMLMLPPLLMTMALGVLLRYKVPPAVVLPVTLIA